MTEYLWKDTPRGSRLAASGQPVGRPTNDHVGELTDTSLEDYAHALSIQTPDRAKNPTKRKLALALAEIKVLYALISRISTR